MPGRLVLAPKVPLQVLAVVLGPAGDCGVGGGGGSGGGRKVLAHGMGGLGKTTLAAAIARDSAVRAHYSRVSQRRYPSSTLVVHNLLSIRPMDSESHLCIAPALTPEGNKANGVSIAC